MGRSKFHGYMLSLKFHFFYAVISLQLQVGPVIIGLVVDGVACLEDKCGYVVGLEKMCGPSSKCLSWPSKNKTWGLSLLAPQVLLKRLIAFILPYLSIYPDGMLWTSQSLGRFQ